MSNPFVPTPPVESTFRPRVWPGVVLVTLMLAMLVVPAFIAERTGLQFMLLMFAPLVAVGGGAIWWLALSRVGWVDRTLALALFLVPAAGLGVEEVVGAPGQPPMGVFVYGVPFVFLCWVGGLVIGLPLPGALRRGVMYLALLLAWGAFGMIRIDGIRGNLVPDQIRWRWEKKPEQAILDVVGQRQSVTLETPAEVVEGDWAEFRGPNRYNRVEGVTLDMDWSAQPPKKVWDVDVGPGWGSFAVAGDRLYTMEQQGDNEAVLCLDAATGKMAWEKAFTYPAFFTEKISGAGPRSTPTVTGGKVYTYGATGFLTCLDAVTGAKVWQVNAETTVGATPPTPFWGYASSPLVTKGLVIVYTGGSPDKGTSAFKAEDGSLVWSAGKATHGYASAQLATIGGIEQVLMLSNHGLEAFDPETGKALWDHAWPMAQGNRSLQPTVVGEGDFLIGSGVGEVLGTRRVKVTRTDDPSAETEAKWKVETVWETGPKFSPYFNDGVVFQGHYYGFSGNNFICVDLANGKVKWDEGKRFGNGQVLLFAETGQLLVTSEYGKMVLVQANPEEYDEWAAADTIAGKMWNHAAYARGKLYLRSDSKAACFELTTK